MSDEIIIIEPDETFYVEVTDDQNVVMSLEGAPGPQGIKGDKGDKGDTGATGPAGGVVSVVDPLVYDPTSGLLSVNTSEFDMAGTADAALQAAKNYTDQHTTPHVTYSQNTSQSVWTIQHNLNTKPVVTVVDSANQEVYGNVQYIDFNSLQITFASAFSGTAYLI